MWSEMTAGHDVLHLAPSRDQSVGQHSAVASPPHGLGAHHGGTFVPGRRNQPCQNVTEFRGFHVVGVSAETP